MRQRVTRKKDGRELLRQRKTNQKLNLVERLQRIWTEGSNARQRGE